MIKQKNVSDGGKANGKILSKEEKREEMKLKEKQDLCRINGARVHGPP